jgi:uncharacterized membrane protein YbaN (DUF454 family)
MKAGPASRAVHARIRPLYACFGLGCVVLGTIGYVVPGLPGTVFFIVALWAFKRSSPRLEDWLLNRSFIGPTLRDWEEDKSIRRSTKVTILVMLWSSILLSMAIVWRRPSGPWLTPLLAIIAGGVTAYILTRRTKAEHQAGSPV